MRLLRPLNYDPNHYDHDPNNPPLTPRKIIAMSKAAAKKPTTPHTTKLVFQEHSPVPSAIVLKKVPAMRVAGVIIRLPDNSILVTLRSKNRATFASHWDIPGGKEEPHESSREAALREVKEETGLDIDPQALRRLKTHQVVNELGQTYLSTCFLYDVADKPEGIQELEPKKNGPWLWEPMAGLINNQCVPGLRAAIIELGTPAAPPRKLTKAEKEYAQNGLRTIGKTKGKERPTNKRKVKATTSKEAKPKKDTHPDVDLFNKRMGVRK